MRGKAGGDLLNSAGHGRVRGSEGYALEVPDGQTLVPRLHPGLVHLLKLDDGNGRRVLYLSEIDADVEHGG